MSKQAVETTVAVVKGWDISYSLAVVIPSDLRKKNGLKKGDLFTVKTDEKNRIIYEPLVIPS